MKVFTRFLLVFTLLNCLTNPAVAQDSKEDAYDGPAYLGTNVIFAQPLSFFIGGGELGWERMYAKNKSLRLLAGYFVKEQALIYGRSDFEGFRFELQARFYLQEDQARGNFNDLYVGPYAYYKQIELSRTITTFPGGTTTRSSLNSASGLGLLLGYQFMTSRNITFDLFAGGGLINPHLRTGTQDAHIPLVNPYHKAMAIRFGFAIGLGL